MFDDDSFSNFSDPFPSMFDEPAAPITSPLDDWSTSPVYSSFIGNIWHSIFDDD